MPSNSTTSNPVSNLIRYDQRPRNSRKLIADGFLMAMKKTHKVTDIREFWEIIEQGWAHI